MEPTRDPLGGYPRTTTPPVLDHIVSRSFPSVVDNAEMQRPTSKQRSSSLKLENHASCLKAYLHPGTGAALSIRLVATRSELALLRRLAQFSAVHAPLLALGLRPSTILPLESK
ncbi:uncharacterized protein UTRI_01146 [Ustilago trichophora]|uniref:Uncharacterized protein n=1 Tax=Ustilago trichophora TaxID=86804 RepID=A0A5C3DW96_9BASI|nr:uncharacterized protein UTRI_01146 [Ustilago trichophora]